MADFVVSLTKKGRELEAQQLLYGYGFRVDYFVLGAGGHDTGNPMVALPLNTDVLELPGQFFGPEPIDDKSLVTPTCPRFICIAQPGEAVGGISNLGLVATMTYNPATRTIDTVVQDPTSGVATVTTVAPHGFVYIVGDPTVIEISGNVVGNPPTETPANGQWEITGILSPTSFTIQPPLGNSAWSGTGGTVVDQPYVGDTFLYAIVHFPLRYKVSASRETFTVSIKT